MSRSVTERFSGRASEYDRYRERYDAAILLPRLREWIGLTPAWRIADMGAGTGMLSDIFLANGNQVTAVEPNPEMRAACTALHTGEPRLSVRNGTAEATGLDAASADMVTVGRALHWFDLPAALAEFRRILRPGGWVVVAGLGRRTDQGAANLGLERLLQQFSADKRPTHATYAVYDQLEPVFAGGRFFHEEIPQEAHLSWPHFRGLTQSLSHAPLEGSPSFPVFERELQHLFEELAVDGLITLETRYSLVAGQFSP